MAERPSNDELQSRAMQAVKHALRDLQFGEVKITVQDGVILQIERTERIRLRRDRDR